MNKIQHACVALFVLAAASTANAQSAGSNSSSSASSVDTSSSTAIGGGNATGGNSRVSGSGNSTNALTATGGKSSSTSALTGSGNSSVKVIIAQGTGTGTGSSGTGSVAQGVANDAPGSSPYNTQTQDNVSYSGTQTVKTNPAIQAPGLTTTLSDTCMGSVSFGFSAPGFGATAGSTLVDEACVRRLDAREFRAMGLTDVALALLCQSDANRRAVEATGHLCPGTSQPLAKTKGEPSASATVSDDVKYRDPIVRRRMGLPPLDDQPTAAPTPPKADPTVTTKAVVPTAPAVAVAPVAASSPSYGPTIVTPPIASTAPQPIPLSENNQVLTLPVEDIASKVEQLK